MSFLKRNIFIFSSLTIGSVALCINFLQLFDVRPFWYDEIVTVSWSTLPFSDFLQAKLRDVHPPFYEFFLKFWLMFFNQNESSIRFSSFIFFIFGNLILLIYIKKNFSENIFYFSIIILFTNLNLIHYSNEARMYALMFLLSSYLITNRSLENNTKISYSFLICSLILSLTHYFGLILVFVIFFYIFCLNLKNFSNLLKLTITGLLCMVWPLIHLKYGTLSEELSSQSWIVSNFGDSFDFVLSLLNPYKYVTGSVDTFIFFFLILIFISYKLFNKKNVPHFLIILLLFTLLISIIDFYKPISNLKSYILLLPILLIIICYFLQIILNKKNYYLNFSFKIISILVGIQFLIVANNYLNLREVKDEINIKKAVITSSQNLNNRMFYFYNKYDYNFSYYFEKFIDKKKPLNFRLISNDELSENNLIFFSSLNKNDYLDLIKRLNDFKLTKVFPLNSNVLDYSEIGVILIDKN